MKPLSLLWLVTIAVCALICVQCQSGPAPEGQTGADKGTPARPAVDMRDVPPDEVGKDAPGPPPGTSREGIPDGSSAVIEPTTPTAELEPPTPPNTMTELLPGETEPPPAAPDTPPTD